MSIVSEQSAAATDEDDPFKRFFFKHHIKHERE